MSLPSTNRRAPALTELTTLGESGEGSGLTAAVDEAPDDRDVVAVSAADEDPAVASGWVDAGPFRLLWRDLVETSGLDWRTLAVGIGLPSRVAHRLLDAGPQCPRRIRAVDAMRLLAETPVSIRCAGGLATDAEAASQDVRQLLRYGVDLDWAAAFTACPSYTLIELSRGGLDTVRASQAWSIRALRECIEAERARYRRHPNRVLAQAA